MSCDCGTFRKVNEVSSCGGFQPTGGVTPPPPPTPVALGEATTLIDPSGAGIIATPGGLENGDMLIACVGHNDSTVTPPAEFSEFAPVGVFDALFAGFNWETTLYYHVVTDAGSEPATYTFDGNGAYVDIWLVCVKNGDTTNLPPDASRRPVAPTVDTNAFGSSVFAPADGSLLLRFEASNSENRDSGPPEMAAIPGSPIDTTFNADYELNVAAGLTGPRSSTYLNPQTWTVHMVIIGPVP